MQIRKSIGFFSGCSTPNTQQLISVWIFQQICFLHPENECEGSQIPPTHLSQGRSREKAAQGEKKNRAETAPSTVQGGWIREKRPWIKVWVPGSPSHLGTLGVYFSPNVNQNQDAISHWTVYLEFILDWKPTVRTAWTSISQVYPAAWEGASPLQPLKYRTSLLQFRGRQYFLPWPRVI